MRWRSGRRWRWGRGRRGCKARDPKSEIRDPKEIRNPNSENRQDVVRAYVGSYTVLEMAGLSAGNGFLPERAVGLFGFRISGFFRISDLGFRISGTGGLLR